MHTPEEAAELWCPMARVARREPVDVIQEDGTIKASGVALSHVGGCNRDALGGYGASIVSCRCVASDCAMWRWVPSTTTHTKRKITEVTFGQYEESTEVVPDAPTHGYCGLAGSQMTND